MLNSTCSCTCHHCSEFIAFQSAPNFYCCVCMAKKHEYIESAKNIVSEQIKSFNDIDKLKFHIQSIQLTLNEISVIFSKLKE